MGATFLVFVSLCLASIWAILLAERKLLENALGHWSVIVIHEMCAGGVADKIDRFIERTVLFRRELGGYNNAISGNRRLIASFFTTLWIGWIAIGLFILFLPGKNGVSLFSSGVFAVLPIWGLLFWRERSSMYQTWRYLAELYDRYITTPPDQPPQQSSNSDQMKDLGRAMRARKIRAASLGHDILDLHHWAHRSFRTVFSSVIRESTWHASLMFTKDTNGSESEREAWFEQAWSHISRCGIERSQAKLLLSAFQWNLLPEEDFLRSDKEKVMGELLVSMKDSGIFDLGVSSRARACLC